MNFLPHIDVTFCSPRKRVLVFPCTHRLASPCWPWYALHCSSKGNCRPISMPVAPVAYQVILGPGIIGQCLGFETAKCTLWYKLVGTVSCAQIDLRKSQWRELGTLDESQGPVGLLNPVLNKYWRQYPGGGKGRHLRPRFVQKLESRSEKKITLMRTHIQKSTRSEYHTELAKMSFDKIFDLTAEWENSNNNTCSRGMFVGLQTRWTHYINQQGIHWRSLNKTCPAFLLS